MKGERMGAIAYKVVTADRLDILAVKVETELLDGWEPQGGVSGIVVEIDCDGVTKILLAQAMVHGGDT
jgi:hypothetical protein